MEAKRCEQCRDYFNATRSDAKFCSNKCRQNSHREKNNIPEPDFMKGFEKKKGLGSINENKPLQTKVLGKEYLKLNGELQVHKTAKILYDNDKKKLVSQYDGLIQKNPQLHKSLMVLGGAVGGGIIGTQLFDKKDKTQDKVIKVGLSALAFGFSGLILNEIMKEDDKIVLDKLNKIRNRIAKIDLSINSEYFLIVELENKLRKVPKYVIEQPEEERIYVPMFGNIEKEKVPVYANKMHQEQPKTEQREEKTHSIINSVDLQGRTFKTLDFKGKWGNFIGKPQPNFYATIYGKAGQGKSNFSFQLAEYLASNHGKVLYVAREEGISATTQGKLNLNNATSKYLDFTDMHQFDNIDKAIKERHYVFVVLDSVNTLELEPTDIQVLRKNNPHLGVICVQQATKNGTARGSNAYSHDADINIEISNGQATTTKNRFAEKTNEPYNIFN